MRLPPTSACDKVFRMTTFYRLDCGARFIFGWTANPRNRMALHRYALRAGKHADAKLQKAFDKAGKAKFSFLRYAELADVETVTEDYRLFFGSCRGWTGTIDTDNADLIRRILTKENRRKLSEAKRGARNPRARRAMAIERVSGKVALFRTTVDLARFAGVSQQAASTWITGKTPFPGEGPEKRGASQRHRRLAKWRLVRL